MCVRFFDIHSTKAKQFGFRTDLEKDISLVCLGDEPYNSLCKPYVEGADWMLCEAFCLYGMRDIFHTEDTDLKNRKKQYTKEVKLLYSGNVYVPDDLEVLKL